MRSAWWSAEEQGLLGSSHYVEELTTTGRGEGAGPGPQGSAATEDVFEAFHERRDLTYEGTDSSGRSDYGPFIDPAVGIPAGGLFTGAEGVKTPEQAELFGGTPCLAHDPCHHQACDTLRNVSYRVLGQDVDAIAYATGVFARSTEALNGRGCELG